MILSLNYLFGKKEETFDFEKSFELKEKEVFETVGILNVENLFCEGQVRSYGDSLLLNMNYSLDLHKICDRCLEEYNEYIDGELSRTISKTDNGSIDCIESFDGNMNLHDIVCDEIMMITSSQSLCNVNCEGLCPECGINLNEESCDCDKNRIDPRFSALLDL